jgi:hypothetical protein
LSDVSTETACASDESMPGTNIPTVGSERSGVYSRLVTTRRSALSNSIAPNVSGALKRVATMSVNACTWRGGIVKVWIALPQLACAHR